MLNSSSMLPSMLAANSPDDRHKTGTTSIHKGALLWWEQVRPKMNPVDSPMNNLQKMSSSNFVKHDIISGVPYSPKESTYTNSNTCFRIFIYPIKPMSKHISNSSRWGNIKSEVEKSPNIFHKGAGNKQMLNGFIFRTKRTFFYIQSNFVLTNYP